VKNETIKATRGGINIYVLTPETGKSMYKKSIAKFAEIYEQMSIWNKFIRFIYCSHVWGILSE
jgi:hypothetical protein